jgi:hypothetical protein
LAGAFTLSLRTVCDALWKTAQIFRVTWLVAAARHTTMPTAPLVAYACSLHASTDFREKCYKIFQNWAKIAAQQPGADKDRWAKIASTLSQSRGIFKVLKWVNNIETYQSAADEADPLVQRLKTAEAYLNTVVTMMQDCIALDKLCMAKLVTPRFVWWMNFLDLLLSALLAGIAVNAIRLLQRAGGLESSPKAQRKLLLLRLELGVRVFDALALLHETCVPPGGSGRRRLWPAPSASNALLANVLSATLATSAVGIKKWAALPSVAASVGAKEQPQPSNGDKKGR